MNEQIVASLVNGIDSSVPDAAKQKLEHSLRLVSKELENSRQNKVTKTILGTGATGIGNPSKTTTQSMNLTDSQIYTNISEMINGSDKDPAGFGTLLDSLVMKNKKYYSIIKDYEIMPILIPQINRVLMFLVNECISPDIQNESTFQIKFIPDKDPDQIQADIDEIKKEMRLDNLLRDVWMNRYKLGHEFYLVVDYNQTFDHMLEVMKQKQLVESASGCEKPLTDLEYLDLTYNSLTETINDCTCKLRIQSINETPNLAQATMRELGGKAEDLGPVDSAIVESTIDLNFEGMNIKIERSGIARLVEDAHGQLLAESFSKFKINKVKIPTIHQSTDKTIVFDGLTMNEAATDTSKLAQLVTDMKKKKLQRCMIERLDPAKVFKLKIGGRVIGFFVVSDLAENNYNTVNFAQALKDQLLKSRATNLQTTTKTAEEVISKTLAEKIVNTFDPTIGINRIEDIDLMHDFVRNNEIYKGNKRITFYYEDEIFDLSRADDSILTNGVFFTKLYSTLLLNNIMTKVLRGRGRQIHTVRMGASPNVQRYIQNAMASLTMPENNLGTMHGSFEQILNPFNASSDIIIPTEDDNAKYIETDYIPGQDVDMNDEFLRFLLNAIVSSFGLDSAVIDATNGNLQFARTLSMESLQICNMVRNEQQDLHDGWERMCLEVIKIMGKDETKKAVDRGEIRVKFFEPKSLMLQNSIEDINNAKSYAENIADIIPEFNGENMEQKRSKFVYMMVKEMVNLDWGFFEQMLKEANISAVGDKLEDTIRKIAQEYEENIREEQYGDSNGDGLVTDDDTGTGLSDEEADLLNEPDEDVDF